MLASWFRADRSGLSRLLQPLSWLYGWGAARARHKHMALAQTRPQPDCAVVVVGNLVVGGAGKTPTTVAVVQALRSAGFNPGVVSRGHGRVASASLEVRAGATAEQVGDEPLLIHRRCGVPVVVGTDRVAAALQLCKLHPRLDVIVSDDGLQHRQLRRDVEVIVFDGRGVGNGLLLPAGPLREPLGPQPPPKALVLYNHDRPTTPWPGHCATRRLTGAWPLQQWLNTSSQPVALSTLRGRRLLAMAGVAVPERFFTALEHAGLDIVRWPQPDHHPYDTLPWPPDTADVITTEKDAVKLGRWTSADTRVWVVGLDLDLPAAFVADLLARMPREAASGAAPVAPQVASPAAPERPA
jgi:tetraacyldisaccharide 4'-kinase